MCTMLARSQFLRQLHDRLDQAVADAYGWPIKLTTRDIFARLIALNLERRAEEADGLVRWLHPEFQAPEEVKRASQPTLDMDDDAVAADAVQWPRNDTAGQYVVLRNALARAVAPAAPGELVRLVKGAPRGAKIGEMLRVLTALGQARSVGDGRFSA
jgi:hypothetical protein